jgi:hypothetical protein
MEFIGFQKLHPNDANIGLTGPFWVGSALAFFSALITFFFIRPLSPDGMLDEDTKVRFVLFS